MRQTMQHIIQQLQRDHDILLYMAHIRPPNPSLLEDDPFLDDPRYAALDHQDILNAFAQADGVTIQWVSRRLAQQRGQDISHLQELHDDIVANEGLANFGFTHVHPAEIEDDYSPHGCIYIPPLREVLAFDWTDQIWFDGDIRVWPPGGGQSISVPDRNFQIFDWGRHYYMWAFSPILGQHTLGVSAAGKYGVEFDMPQPWQHYLDVLTQSLGRNDRQPFNAPHRY